MTRHWQALLPREPLLQVNLACSGHIQTLIYLLTPIGDLKAPPRKAKQNSSGFLGRMGSAFMSMRAQQGGGEMGVQANVVPGGDSGVHQQQGFQQMRAACLLVCACSCGELRLRKKIPIDVCACVLKRRSSRGA